MIAFLIICIVLVLWVQRWLMENTAEFVDADFRPDENVVDPDDVFNIVVELKNKKAFPVLFIRLRMTFPKEFNVIADGGNLSRRNVNDSREVSVSTWLKANQTLKVKIPVSISARGCYFLPHLILSFGDFLGLKEKQKEIVYFREVVAAPVSYETDEVKQVLGKFLGEHSVRRFIYEDPVLTVGFREYSGREPMKMISWKQSARRQQLMVREYDHTIEPVLSVVVNMETTAENTARRMEKVYSIARSVCANLEEKGVSYSFFTNVQMTGGSGDMFSVDDGTGTHHFKKIMERLGRGTYNSAFSCEKLLYTARKANGNERGLIVITPDTTAVSATEGGQILVLNAYDF